MDKIRVLLIDDEEDFCRLVQLNLERTGGYEVGIVTDPRMGLKAALEYGPDLVLLDIMMPGMSGLEVLKKLKGNPKTLSIPVLMLTALTDAASKQQAVRLFNEDYIEKPVDPAALRTRIEKALSRWRSAPPSAG